MANFCRACTGDIFGTDVADRNDLRGSLCWAVCEGCGWHLFDTEGSPLCGDGDEANRPLLAACGECLRRGAMIFRETADAARQQD